MHKLRQLLQQNCQDYDNLMMWAAYCIAFFGFLNCIEFTTFGQQEYDPQVHLQYEDVAVDCRNNPRMLMVPIKQSKTDLFKQEVTLWLGKTDCAVCPVTGILMARGSHPDPLFITSKGTYMTRQSFHTLLPALLVKASLPQKQFNTHSFKIEEATSAKAAHISDVYTHKSYGPVAKQRPSVIYKDTSNRHGILLKDHCTAGSLEIVPKQLTYSNNLHHTCD